MEVTLTWAELQQAALVGCQRYIRALWRERNEIYGTPPDPWGVHITGAAAEMAVAKALGVFWPYATDPDWGGDVGTYHVRSTNRDDGCLILHDRDPDDGVFVLAIGTPRTYRLAGWLTARDGKTAAYWRSNVREPCFMVPQHDLAPMAQWR